MKNNYSKVKRKMYAAVILMCALAVSFQLSAQAPASFNPQITIYATINGKQVPVVLSLGKADARTIQNMDSDVMLVTGNDNSGNQPTTTKSKTSGLNLQAANVCDTVRNVLVTDTYGQITYTIGGTSPGGFLGGTGPATLNYYADEFNTSFSGATHIQYFDVIFRKAVASTPTGEFYFKIWDRIGTGAPNAEIGSIAIRYKYVQDLIAFNGGVYAPLRVSFATPITIPSPSKDFFIGVQAGQISTDSLAIALGMDTIGNTGWFKSGAGAWGRVSSTFQWTTGPNAGKAAHVRGWITAGITDEPVTVTPTPLNGDTICAGGAVNYSATGSSGVARYQWSFPGGSLTSSTNQNPGNVTYSNPGVFFYNIQGFNTCGFSHSLPGVVKVDTLPPVVINSDAAICRGVAYTLTASGANTYVWNGPGINGLTTNTVSINQTTSTTYSLTGTRTDNGCSKLVTKTINIVADPVALYSYAVTDTLCPETDLQYNSSTSTGAVSYLWTFPGGNPSSSTQANPAVGYATTGVFNTKLVVDNGCGQKDSLDNPVFVQQCVYLGINDASDNKIQIIFDPSSSTLKLTLGKEIQGVFNLTVYNNLGQLITTKNVIANTSDAQYVQLPDLTKGVYHIRLSDNNIAYSDSFIKQ